MADDTSFDITKVLKALPHRYPLLLVDRVRELEKGERIHAVKGVTFNEEFFQGHFPGRPIMPGVLQVEALVYFMGIENAKFRAPVEPGCLLDLKVEFVQKRSRVYKFKGEASVEGKTTCNVEFTAMIADPPA